MDSNKSSGKSDRGALKPQRRPGKERVAALMEAAATVIAEKGYEAATMAEIASRAGALIGSLYHFFPNKEALADALIERYAGIIDEAFTRLDSQAASMPIEALADALVHFLIEIKGESKAMMALLESRPDSSVLRLEFRGTARRRVARTLMLRSPRLRPDNAYQMAVVLLHNMKFMKTLVDEQNEDSIGGVAEELRDMTRLYLEGKLAKL
jgi:AcrR family transcriptional regulator